MWSCQFGFYGPEKVIAAQWAAIKRRYTDELPGTSFADGEVFRFPLNDEQRAKLQTPGNPEKVEFGIPNLSRFGNRARSWTNPDDPSWGHLWFSPIIPKSGEALFEADAVFTRALAELGAPEAKIGYFVTPMQWFSRSFVLLFALPITRDIERNRRSRSIFRELAKVSAEHGWAEYRAPAAFMDEVADVYSFNDHALRRFHQTLKDAADPNGIISAGRGGVWPKHLRERRA